ncbi:MAG: RNA repair transcriptional activator RtcR [Deltaproteobacteria bacterium]|nr:RNA repair transcriptional activator RtcR [Deltaproteobacteria bacterium]
MRPLVVLGLLGTSMDAGRARRWESWRPTVDLCRHEDLVVHRLELLHGREWKSLADVVAADVAQVSPETVVRTHEVSFKDPWDLGEVYARLADFARGYAFRPDDEDYLVHITTGTHVAQICLFLLTESRHFPGRLLQTSPPDKRQLGEPGRYQVIDLDLQHYDQIAARTRLEKASDVSFLKSGIETRNKAFNTLIEEVEQVASSSSAPLLLLGPTGAGKTRLARRIHELKHARRKLKGRFVEVNCATVRGDGAMSALFGHTRGAYTGAVAERAGLLRSADGGVLFLDEIGELGLEEQAMLLRAIEDKVFLPVGSDKEVTSDFQLIAGTNRDLRAGVVKGTFRDDLLARIDLWTFALPGLADRREDIEPNLEYELERASTSTKKRVTFSSEARSAYLGFALSSACRWPGNFRELSGSALRMATLAPGGRITLDVVLREIDRLQHSTANDDDDDGLAAVLDAGALAALDRFDRVQLADVVAVCSRARSMSEAGRTLFAASRQKKTTANDADRLRKYLAGFGLSFADLQSGPTTASNGMLARR